MDRPVTGGLFKMIDGVRTRVDEDGFPIQLDDAGVPVVKNGSYVRIAEAPAAPSSTESKAKGGSKSERA